MPLYSLLLLCSITIPLLLSFDKKLQFYKQWKYLFSSISVIAIIYIIFDYILTNMGVWGFNEAYHSAFICLGLPMEEWLFFIVIPYASIFLHDSIVLYFKQLKLGRKLTTIVSYTLIGMSALLIIFNIDKTYTVYIFIKVILVLLFARFDKSEVISQFYITFLIILIPFSIINGILTGSFIEEQVVWYNNEEILGLRFFTIPIEDFAYAFSLIAFVLLLRIQLINLFKRELK